MDLYEIRKLMTYYQKTFCKDPCKNMRGQCINVCAQISAHTRAHVYAYIFALCVRVRGRILTKIILVVPYFVMNLSLKFHEDPSIRCGDIYKIVRTSKR